MTRHRRLARWMFVAAGVALVAPPGARATSSTEPASSAAPAPTATCTEPAAAVGDTPAPTPPCTIAELLGLGREIVLAHTGGEGAYPGSTMYAFGESVKAGVDMLDLNVMLTKDDRIVIQHDGTVDRTTDATGEVVTMTYDELAKLDNAYWFTADCGACHDAAEAAYVWRGVRTGAKPAPAGYTADDFRVPTLDELIARYPGVPLNIEIEAEGDGKRTADKLNELLRSTNMIDRVVVASFDDEIVSYFHSIAPEVEISPGIDATTAYVLGGTPLPFGMRILQLPPKTTVSGTEITVISPELIAKTKQDGYMIWVWPNNRAFENFDSYRYFLAQGVVGLNIDFPIAGVAAVRA